MSNAEGLFASRVDRSSGTARLALGDLLVIVGFLTAGAISHGVDPVASPLAVAETAVPFLVGWAVAATAVGAYAPGATRAVKRAIPLAAAGWVGAAAIGLALRSTPYFEGSAPLSFAIVITTVGVVSLSLWRGAVAVLR